MDTSPEKAAEIMGGTVEDNLFDDAATRIPGSGEYFKFENVGDSVQGVLVMEPYEQEGDYGPQMIYVVQTAEGKEYNVALKVKTHARTISGIASKGAKVGDIIAFRRDPDVDTGKGNPAKPISARVRKLGEKG